MTHPLLTEQNIALLHEWDLTDFPNYVSQKNTGCNISGALVVPFIKDTIEELREELIDTTPYESDEVILARHGYDIITESPYELEKDGEEITGECANWLIQYYRQNFRTIPEPTPIDLRTLNVGDVVYRSVHNESGCGIDARSYSKDTVAKVNLDRLIITDQT
jgi:hypothetical protein